MTDLFADLAALDLDADLSSAEASALLADLLPHPQQSSARKPRKRANAAWFFQVKERALAHQAPFDPAPGSPYPLGAFLSRAQQLCRRGADPALHGLVYRAVSRKSLHELEALLALPTPAPVMSASSAGAIPLHRAAYAGPDALFDRLAAICPPEAWSALDAQGRTPFHKALQSLSLHRALICARHLDFSQLEPDPFGATPLHHLASALDSLLRSRGPLEPDEPWGQLLALVIRARPEDLTARDAHGRDPAGLFRMDAARVAFWRQHARVCRDQLDAEAPPREPAPKASRGARL